MSALEKIATKQSTMMNNPTKDNSEQHGGEEKDGSETKEEQQVVTVSDDRTTGEEETTRFTLKEEEKKNRIEQHPYKGISYVLGVLQFMLITLDLFMDTSVQLAWHYSITVVESLTSLYLCGYQFLRLYFWLLRQRQQNTPPCDVFTSKTFCIVVGSLATQTGIVVMSSISYAANLDSLEWTMFALAILWGILHPMTFDAIAASISNSQDNNKKNNRNVMGPASAVWSIFRHHFIKAPFLAFLGTLFATAHALLTTAQGAIVNEISKGVTKTNPDGTPKLSSSDVTNLAAALVGVWAATSLAKFIFDILSAIMFARLEVWLRREIVDRAMHDQQKQQKEQDDDKKFAEETATTISLASYQARYASDVANVVGLYGSLLKGLVVNLLLIATNFCYLAYEEWRVACVTLGFLSMGVTGGPTNLAGQNAAATQRHVTAGLSLLGEADGNTTKDATSLIQQHEDEVLGPLKGTLFRRTFFTDSVDTFVQFFSSFLTTIVVITMSWAVYNGDMDGSEFLGVFFVFKQVQKPATKISGIIKKLAGKTANLERVNAVVLTPTPTKDATKE